MARLCEVVDELDEHINSSFAEIFEASRQHFAAVVATVSLEPKVLSSSPKPVEREDDGRGLEGPATKRRRHQRRSRSR